MMDEANGRAAAQVSNLQFLALAVFIVVIFAAAQFDPSMVSAVGYHAVAEPLDVGIDTKETGLLGRRLALPVLAAIASLWLFWRGKRSVRLQHGLLGGLLLAALAWSLASVFWAHEPSFATRKITVLLCLWTGALWIAALVPMNRMPEFTALTVLPFLVLGVAGEAYAGALRPFDSGYRFAGFFHPNTTGQYLAFGVLASTMLAVASRRRALPTFCLVVFASFLYLSKSRTSLFGVLVGLSAIGVLTGLLTGLSSRRAAFRLIMVAGIVIIIACSAYIVAGDHLTQGLTDWLAMGRDPGELGTLTNRTLTWSELLGRYVSQRPFTGYGYGAFWTTQHMVAMSLLNPGDATFQSHSGYLELVLSVGIIGAALHVGYMMLGTLVAIREYLRSRNIGSVFGFGALVMSLTLMLTETVNFDVSLPAFLPMIVIARFALVAGSARPMPWSPGDRSVGERYPTHQELARDQSSR